MNRQLKFRAWDDISKRFYPQNILSVLPLDVFLASKNIQQYTGLQDSNDKEIYEGDILKIKFDVGGNIIGQVIYEPDQGGYIFKYKRTGPNQDYINLNCDVAFESVVVGNIFENGELVNTLSTTPRLKP